MTIIQIAPMEGTVYHPLQSQSHRVSCWEDGFIEVPEGLQEKAYGCHGHCELTIENGVLTDIVPQIPAALHQVVPTAQEDRDTMLIDVMYRITLLESGVG